MDRKELRSELELAIRGHAQAMYDWANGEVDEDYVISEWKEVKELLKEV
jgi:hypothetical protein